MAGFVCIIFATEPNYCVYRLDVLRKRHIIMCCYAQALMSHFCAHTTALINFKLKLLAQHCIPALRDLSEMTLIVLMDHISMLIRFHSHLIRKLVGPLQSPSLSTVNKIFIH